MNESILNVSIEDLCKNEDINQTLVMEVVEFGIARPVEGNTIQDWKFDTSTVHWLKKAIRLNRQLEIDWVGVAMVIELLKQREALEYENHILQRQLARFLES